MRVSIRIFRKWNKWTLNRLIKKIDAKGLSNRTTGGGRKCSACTADNIAHVEQLICSQEDNPGTSKSPREIEHVTGISHSSVRRIVKQDLRLKVQKPSDSDSTKHLAACKQLKRRMTDDKISKSGFADEKIFTVQTPKKHTE